MNLVEILLGGGVDDAVALQGRRGTTTYAQLGDRAGRLAASLLDGGLDPGDRVAIASGNDEAFVVAYLGVLHAGGIAVPLNPSAPPAELGRELAHVEPHIVLGWGPVRGILGAAGASVTPIDLDALTNGTAPRVARADDDVAVLLFTSGTAGAPKAAMLTHANLAANVHQVLEHPGLRLDAGDVGLAALPFFHVFGLNVVLGVALASGSAVVLSDRFDPGRTIGLVREHGVTVVAGVPGMFQGWLELSASEAPDDAFASVRLAVSGAAPLDAAVAAAFEARFGVVLHQGYGLTEAAPIVTTTAIGAGRPRPGSIGPPLPGVEVRVVDDEGSDVLSGDPGEIWVSGPNVFPGYWNDPEASARALTAEHWLRTGDVAVIEDAGDLRLVDRAKDLIIVSGFNVYPVEVEDVLREHPDVDEAAIVGFPSARTGETVVAYVVIAPGHTITDDDLSAHCARALARYKCPTRYEIVDELPRTLGGKLLRRALRDAT